MNVCETERLTLRWLTSDDAEFILALLNDPGFIQNIGDRNVRDLEGARQYISKSAVQSYERHGFGLNLVALKDGLTPIGICGLIKRDDFEDVDIGYAFLEPYWGKGYAAESAAAILAHGRRSFGLKRIVAFTAPDNEASKRVLTKIGLKYEKDIDLPAHGGLSSFFVFEE